MDAYITGATGFVGSNIAAAFAAQPDTIVHCPVRSEHPDPALSTESLDLLDTSFVDPFCFHLLVEDGDVEWDDGNGG